MLASSKTEKDLSLEYKEDEFSIRPPVNVPDSLPLLPLFYPTDQTCHHKRQS
jgi:hypothetical protein